MLLGRLKSLLGCTKCLFEADKVLRSGGQSPAEGKEGGVSCQSAVLSLVVCQRDCLSVWHGFRSEFCACVKAGRI